MHHIVKEIEARGMPLELALLPVVESAFEPYAHSWARANGLWQFMPGTGERFGLKQDWWYDGRRDVIASTRAALDYLQYMHDEFFDDWLLAIAAYNCGEFRVQREVNKNRAAGKPRGLLQPAACRPKRAPTCRSCMAMRRLVANPEDYGIAFSPIPNEPYFASVETGGQLDLTLAAELAGITLDEVYELNPGFHRWATDPAGPHFLLLPRDTADAFSSNLELLSPDERVRVSLHKVKTGRVGGVDRQEVQDAGHRRARHEQSRQREPLVVGSELRVPTAVVNLPAKVMLAAARVDGRGGRSGRRPARARGAQRRFAVAHREAPSHGRRDARAPEWHGPRRHAARRPETGAEHARASVERQVRSSSGSARQVSYKVRSGDTLSRIAQVFGVTVSRPRQLERHQQAVDAAPRPEAHGQRPPALISSPG